jgi:hypothetical protein
VRPFEVASIARDHSKAMVKCGGRNYQVWLGESVSRLAAVFDEHPLSEHDVFGDLKNPPLKHGGGPYV